MYFPDPKDSITKTLLYPYHHNPTYESIGGVSMVDHMMLGVMGAISGVGFLFFAAFYVYGALALMTIAKKTDTERPWLAWIPFANIYLVTQIALKEWWWTLVAIGVMFIPFVGGLAMMGLMAWFFWSIAERRGYPNWVGILMIVPLVNLVVLGLLAWHDQ